MWSDVTSTSFYHDICICEVMWSDVTSHIQISGYLNTPLYNRDMSFLYSKVFSFWWKTLSGGCFRKGIHIDGMVWGANTSLPYLMMINFRSDSVFFYIKRIVFKCLCRMKRSVETAKICDMLFTATSHRLADFIFSLGNYCLQLSDRERIDVKLKITSDLMFVNQMK